MHQHAFNNDLYLIEPYLGQYFLYSPLKGTILLVNKDAISALDYIQQNPKSNYDANPVITKFIETLDLHGLTLQDILEENFPPKPVYNSKPIHVTLLPTFDCNLRCVYCYAESGEASKKRMEWETAKASIDLIASNALETGNKTIRVSFHGGGEPTLNWSLLTETTKYAQEIALKNDLKLRTHITTNGVLSETQCNWLAENITRTQISIDGTQDIQNLQRPMVNGQGSFQHVMKTIFFFEEKKVNYGIQTVITKLSVYQMTDLVKFFASNTSCHELHFEPVFECGRCTYSGWEEPDPEVFAEEFIKAWQQAASLSINLICSLSRLNARVSSFCGATSKNFFVTPEGMITSCLEVSRWSDSRAGTFIFGNYDIAQNKFNINQDKLRFLESRNIYNMPTCSDCAIKWHCAGDCLAKALSNGDMFNPVKTSRCDIAKIITSRQLHALLKNPEIGKVINVPVSSIEY